MPAVTVYFKPACVQRDAVRRVLAARAQIAGGATPVLGEGTFDRLPPRARRGTSVSHATWPGS